MLGGGEQHILRLGPRPRRLRDAGDGGHAPRGRALGGRGDDRRHPRRPRRPGGRVPPREVRDGPGRAWRAVRRLRARLRRARRARHARAGPARAGGRARPGQGRGAAGRGQRRDDGRGLHLGHARSTGAGRGARSSPGSRARNVLLRDGDAFVAMSRAIRDEFLGGRRPAAEGRAHPARRGHRPLPARDARTSAWRSGSASGFPIDGRIIIYTGRLLRGKGLEALITAFRLIAAAEPSAHLVIVGSGEGQSLSVEAELHAAAQADALAARVTFAGRVDAVEDWLRASDVFAFPSMFEALGIALVEAAACGLPAVASRTGGIVDVVEDGRSGVLVPTGRHRGAVDRAPSPGRRIRTSRREMGAAAREVALRAVRRARCRRPLSRAVPRGGGHGQAGGEGRPHRRDRLHRRAAAGAAAGRRAPGGGAGPRRRRLPAAAATASAGSKAISATPMRCGGWSTASTPSCTSPRSTAPPAIPTRTTAT